VRLARHFGVWVAGGVEVAGDARGESGIGPDEAGGDGGQGEEEGDARH
jgi:hypothetical protein